MVRRPSDGTRRTPGPSGPWSRRRFLGAALAGGAWAWIACGRSGPDPEKIAKMAEAYDPDLDCSNTVGLFPAEIRTREENEYVPHSPHATQKCFNCANFITPARKGTCGTCKTVKGPIQPLGWCKSWTEKRA